MTILLFGIILRFDLLVFAGLLLHRQIMLLSLKIIGDVMWVVVRRNLFLLMVLVIVRIRLNSLVRVRKVLLLLKVVRIELWRLRSTVLLVGVVMVCIRVKLYELKLIVWT